MSDIYDPALKTRLKDVLTENPCPTDSISDGERLVEDVDSLLLLSDGVGGNSLLVVSVELTTCMQVDLWLTAVVQAFDAQECSALGSFLNPTEVRIA